MFLDKDERLLPLIGDSNPLALTSLRGLKEVGIKTVRLNCWAYWSEMEPEPGVYCWDKAIEENVALAREAGLKVAVHLYRRAPDWLPKAGQIKIVYNEGSWIIGSRDDGRPGYAWLSVNPFHAETLKIELGFLEQACKHFSVPGEVQCTYSLPYGGEIMLPPYTGEYTEQMCIDVVLARQEVFAEYSDELWSAFSPYCMHACSSINGQIDPHVGGEHAPAVYAAMCEHFPDHSIHRLLYGYFDMQGGWDKGMLPGVKTWVGAEFAANVAHNAKRLNTVGAWGMVMGCAPGYSIRYSQITSRGFDNIAEAIKTLEEGRSEAEEIYMSS
jgi:hypothetical protein